MRNYEYMAGVEDPGGGDGEVRGVSRPVNEAGYHSEAVGAIEGS